MADQCRAAVFPGDSTYEVREFDIPEPPPGGALLKVEAVGLCGSDVAQYQGIELVPGGTAFPVVPGHETVGRVVKLGAGAELGVAEGDRVAVDEILSQAPFRLYGYSDMTGEGKLGLWGGYGEYMEIFPGTRLHKMSDRLPAEQLTLFEPLGERGQLGRHRRRARGRDGRRPGPGPPGARGARGGDGAQARHRRRHRHQSRTGCASTPPPRSGRRTSSRWTPRTSAELVDDLTGGQGADVVFDIASVPADRAGRDRPGARTWARAARGPEALRGDPGARQRLHRVEGTDRLRSGSGFTPESMAKAVAMLEADEVKADVLLGEVFTLDGIDEAMGLLARTDPTRDAVRVGLKHGS